MVPLPVKRATGKPPVVVSPGRSCSVLPVATGRSRSFPAVWVFLSWSVFSCSLFICPESQLCKEWVSQANCWWAWSYCPHTSLWGFQHSFRPFCRSQRLSCASCDLKKVMSQAVIWSHRAKWNITARSRTNARSVSQLYYYEKKMTPQLDYFEE